MQEMENLLQNPMPIRLTRVINFPLIEEEVSPAMGRIRAEMTITLNILRFGGFN